MPAKLPYIPWYPSDWTADTMMLTPVARAVWFDALMYMWQHGRADRITGKLEEIARAGRCKLDEAETAIAEIKRHKIADVRECNGIVTITCRRFKKANNERVRIKEAVKKSRRNGNVTPYITEDILQKTDKEERKEREKRASAPPAPAFDCAVDYPREVADVLAIARKLDCPMTEAQASAYYNDRTVKDWHLGAGGEGRLIRPENVPADIRRWVERDRTDALRRQSPSGRIAADAAEIRKAREL